MTIDAFPFAFEAELDVLEIRLHELADVVDRWVICEAAEDFGGNKKPWHLQEAMAQGRFAEFAHRMAVLSIDKLEPQFDKTGTRFDRTQGREREAFQRNVIGEILKRECADDDVVIFSDCDEIPRAGAVAKWITCEGDPMYHKPARFMCDSYYYNVNTLVDVGNDWAARPRIALWQDIKKLPSLYDFRLSKDVWAMPRAGWHFGYFGGVEAIETKVATLAPFLSEYKLFGREELEKDIREGRDLHHRKCELPEQFTYLSVPPPGTISIRLPQFLQDNKDRFKHFFAKP